ncbi:MAG: hypothetical protein GTO14_02275 [Anaerolineales bacterium]|nr:hypothetical protein [Anaerolineales bacterium]
MVNQEQLTKAFELNFRRNRRQTEGLSHADNQLHPPIRGDCWNWVLGVPVGRNRVLQLLGETPVPCGAERMREEIG